MTRAEKIFWFAVATIGCVGIISLMIALRIGNAQSVLISSLLVAIAFIAVACTLWNTLVELGIQSLWPRDSEGVDDRGTRIVLRHWRYMPSQVILTPPERDSLKIWMSQQRGMWVHALLIGAWWSPAVAQLAAKQFVEIPTVLDWTIGTLIVLPCTIVGFRRIRKLAILLHSRFLAEISRCGSCGYDLSSLTAADDGCTTCPECGAAWRLRPKSASAGHKDVPVH